MRLLTLNTHSVIDEKCDERIDTFCNAILKYQPDIIALQEVMQPITGEIVDCDSKIMLLGEIPIKKGNYLIKILSCLERHSLKYFAAYAGFKKAYESYDEGIAILSKKEISSTELIQISRINEYKNYKTRFALGIRANETWFYSVHFNKEHDSDSPFLHEWHELLKITQSKNSVFVMGDFNITPKSNAYEIISKEYFDTYMIAKEIDNGITVKGEIDGWNGEKEDKRIDYIFSNKNINIKSSYVIFNGKNENIISDHYGILVEKEQI